MSANPWRVEVGQVWADNDWRSRGRTIRVVEVGPSRAVVEVLTESGGQAVKKPRRTKVLLSRFRPNSTGYRLVSNGGAK